MMRSTRGSGHSRWQSRPPKTARRQSYFGNCLEYYQASAPPYHLKPTEMKLKLMECASTKTQEGPGRATTLRCNLMVDATLQRPISQQDYRLRGEIRCEPIVSSTNECVLVACKDHKRTTTPSPMWIRATLSQHDEQMHHAASMMFNATMQSSYMGQQAKELCVRERCMSFRTAPPTSRTLYKPMSGLP